MTTETLDTTLLESHMRTFFGYGNLAAPIWFIGIEQGGGNTFEEVKTRLEQWRNRGSCMVEDVRDYHFAIGIRKFFKVPVVLQRTWGQLIRLYLSYQGKQCQLEDLKLYQKTFFGRANGKLAILELMPLPSPGINRWFYDRWSNLPCLRTRDAYFDVVSPQRISTLRDLIQQQQPTHVIFYGFTKLLFYQQVAGVTFTKQQQSDFYSVKKGGVRFSLIRHPADRGVTNAYFENMGKVIAKTSE